MQNAEQIDSPTIQPEAELWVLVATILASSMAFIGGTALNVALPALQRDLNVQGSQLLWIVNAYMLFLSALILVGGSLGDHYGRKRVFAIGIIAFLVTSFLCGIAQDANTLILLRAAQGIGAALMVPGSLAILTAAFPPDKRGAAIGTWSTFSAVTTIAGPILGGWLTEQGLWRAVFFINIPIGIIALVALILKVPESRDENAPRQLDYLGAALATLGLAGITFGFIQAPEFGWADPRILGTLIGGVVAFVAFVIVEMRSDHPMVNLSLFQSRTFSGTNAMTLFLYAALGVVTFFVPLNLIQVQGYPESVAGFALLPLGASLAVMGRWSGGLVDRIGPRIPLMVGPFLAGIGFGMFGLPGITDGPSDYWLTFFPAALMLGIGMGVTVAPLTTSVMGAAPQEQSGTASGINNAVSRTASVLAIAIVGAIALIVFSNSLDSRTADLSLSEDARTQLTVEAEKLAEAQPPQGLDAETSAAVQTAIDNAFVDTFRLIAVIGLGLAWLSVLMTALFVRPDEIRGAPEDDDRQDSESEAADRPQLVFHDHGCPTVHPGTPEGETIV